jgi:hypothetical protein
MAHLVTSLYDYLLITYGTFQTLKKQYWKGDIQQIILVEKLSAGGRAFALASAALPAATAAAARG